MGRYSLKFQVQSCFRSDQGGRPNRLWYHWCCTSQLDMAGRSWLLGKSSCQGTCSQQRIRYTALHPCRCTGRVHKGCMPKQWGHRDWRCQPRTASEVIIEEMYNTYLRGVFHNLYN